MNRIGIFTGNIYKNGEMPKVGECCITLTDEKLADEKYVEEVKAKNKIRCLGCNGCPASQQGKKVR